MNAVNTHPKPSEKNSYGNVWRWIVEADDEGTRLDHFLRDQNLGITRSQIKKLIDSGMAKVESAIARPAQKLRQGQEIVFEIPAPKPLSLEPEAIPLDVRYEDEFLIVINKQQGLVVHPAIGHASGTLVNAILFGRSVTGGDPLRPGIVHRLDKDTSGLLVVAKCEATHVALARQFHDHTVDRCYHVLVTGSPPNSGEWNTLHGRHPKERRLFSSKVHRGKRAISRFQTIERFQGAAYLNVWLMTGRTHQVRVHCHDHGFSVLGDPLYTPRHLSPSLQKIHKELTGQALHAGLLGFEHPETGEKMRFESKPPSNFLNALGELRSL